jgi:nucleoside-diphosphate-sugar epimerase
VQPLHVDDLIDLVARHRLMPTTGVYPVGGAEALPLRELVLTLAQILGVRCPPIEIPSKVFQLSGTWGRIIHLRPDQLARMLEPKTADATETRCHFGWEPSPVGLRLEQAVFELEDDSLGLLRLPKQVRGAYSPQWSAQVPPTPPSTAST